MLQGHRSTSLFPLGVSVFHFRHRDQRPFTTSSLVSSNYKCPLAQLFSFDILTNARGCMASALPKTSSRGLTSSQFATLFCSSSRSLHQECFTNLLQSTGSALFLKTAGCVPTIPILERSPRETPAISYYLWPIPFPFSLFRTLLRSCKTQPFSINSALFSKNTRGGGCHV
jgi:hypothetical protein